MKETIKSATAEPSIEIPFYAPATELPAPLPSVEEIESSSHVLQSYLGRKVVQWGEKYIIKFGYNVNLIEGENMINVRNLCPAVQVPRVYALFSILDAVGDKKKYIIMERIEGESLDHIWENLSTTDKTEVAARIRFYLDSLRLVPAPEPAYFGSIGRRPFEDGMFWQAPTSSADFVNGPFATEADFNRGLVQNYLCHGGPKHKAAFYSRVLPCVLRCNKAVLTHGDLQKKNIMLQKDGTVVLIDWETTGWYPEYWEYALAVFCCGAWLDDWHEYLSKMLREYPVEYAWFELFRREIWC